MIAYHGKQETKDFYIARVKRHRELDELVQGIAWENGKGCAVGCTLESYDHRAYETELGIPEWLARVEDSIFEGLTKADALAWPEQFLASINPGADLNKVEHPFIIFVLRSNLKNFDNEKYPDVARVTNDIIALHERDEPDESLAWSAAWSAASAAKSAAWSAAWSAAESAARSAARGAESAARNAARGAKSAARGAAENAARSAAWGAARSAAYKMFANKLIELLKDCR